MAYNNSRATNNNNGRRNFGGNNGGGNNQQRNQGRGGGRNQGRGGNNNGNDDSQRRYFPGELEQPDINDFKFKIVKIPDNQLTIKDGAYLVTNVAVEYSENSVPIIIAEVIGRQGVFRLYLNDNKPSDDNFIRMLVNGLGFKEGDTITQDDILNKPYMVTITSYETEDGKVYYQPSAFFPAYSFV